MTICLSEKIQYVFAAVFECKSKECGSRNFSLGKMVLFLLEFLTGTEKKLDGLLRFPEINSYFANLVMGGGCAYSIWLFFVDLLMCFGFVPLHYFSWA